VDTFGGSTRFRDMRESRGVAMHSKDRVFFGTLRFTTDNFLLAPADNGPFIDVSFPFTDSTFDRQQVSILGHMGERVLSGSIKKPSLIVRNIVTHEAVARRAFEIFDSGRGGSAFDNWLRAEMELLTSK
jgi:hypothetical protein